MFPYATLVALLAGAAVVSADPTPSAPGPGDVFREGGQCTLAWDVDPTGTWTEMNVELMTGDNFNMIHLTTVAKLDGTDASKTTYSYDCPQVTPNSAIYFYQFTSPSSANRTWTTRFAIGNNDGNVTPEPNATQPNGQAIPWGAGQLVDPSTAVAAPSYLTGGTSGATTVAGQASGVASIAPGTSAAPGTQAAPASTSASVTASAKVSPAPSTSAANGNKTSGDASTSNTTSANNNAAASALALDGQLVRAAFALGVAAFTFGVVL
ncbi:hypothetical protein BC628DRAFT_1415391 [Trametes gibbosa]|nr:hypothetical protein BC628DRAFT_1415391 [Trametes gibbosa]